MTGHKYKLAVFGAVKGDMQNFLPIAAEVGRIMAERADSIIVVTGACPGLPYAAAHEASKKGAEVWGFSSSLDVAGQKSEYPDDDLSIYKKVVYVPQDFPFAGSGQARKKYRNVISSATCDAAIIISGRWGTLNEFTNLIDQQKTIGVLTGTGGIADELPALSDKIFKPGQGQIIFDKDPKILVEKILSALNTPK